MTTPKLILTPHPTFSATVAITGHGDGESHALEVVYQHKGKKEAGQWLVQLAESDRPAGELLCEIVHSIGGEPATPESLEKLMDDFPRPFADLVGEWSLRLIQGREKNLPRPPAG